MIKILFIEELRAMLGPDDPDERVQNAQTSLGVAKAVTDAYGNLIRAYKDEAISPVLNFGPEYIRTIDRRLRELSNNEVYCPGPQRGVVVPGIGFIALGFGGSRRCGSPMAPLARATLAEVKKDLS